MPDRPTFLAADIGGTSTRLALVSTSAGRIRLEVTERYASRDHGGLEAIVRRFRTVHDTAIAGACFGVAGPVVGDRVEAPNLAWVVDASPLAHALRLPRVTLINDLEANAHGIFELTPADVIVLNAGAHDATGNVAVISAGTGLGEAAMYWDGHYHHPFACEGGHASFSPTSDVEIELLQYLRGKFGGHVSWERVVSGPGLLNVYEFVRDTGHTAEPDWLREALAAGDPPAVISETALDGKSDLCVRALDLFVSAYGAEAGNLALKVMAIGGVYIGGGIAPKIAARLDGAPFMDAFRAKGRLHALLGRIPVKLITNEHTALLGAARCAALHAALAGPAAL